MRHVLALILIFLTTLFDQAFAWAQTERSKPGTLEWLDELQSQPATRHDQAIRLSPLLPIDPSSPPSVDRWREQRQSLLASWNEYLGPMPIRNEPPKVQVLELELVDGVQRQLIRYETEPGQFVEAYLIRPAQSNESKHPALVVFHSTIAYSIRQPAGIEGPMEKAFGMRLAQQGFVTICPRNFLWPTTGKIEAVAEARHLLDRKVFKTGMARMLFDGLKAVDVLVAQNDVDANRLGCVGHSLGAKEVLYLAAFDERIKATVSSEGGIGKSFSNWDDDWYLGSGMNAAAFTLDHHQLLAAIAPRAFLLIGGESADGDKSWPYIDSAMQVYRLFDDRPRLGFWNHRQGHAIPPEAVARIDEWLVHFLK